jgi:opacity protein-like surface antigen
MKRVIITAMLSILAAGNALAADLLPAPPPQAQVFVTAPAIYNWAGAYVGINGGSASEALNETPVRPGRCRARSTTTAGSSGAHSA